MLRSLNVLPLIPFLLLIGFSVPAQAGFDTPLVLHNISLTISEDTRIFTIQIDADQPISDLHLGGGEYYFTYEVSGNAFIVTNKTTDWFGSVRLWYYGTANGIRLATAYIDLTITPVAPTLDSTAIPDATVGSLYQHILQINHCGLCYIELFGYVPAGMGGSLYDGKFGIGGTPIKAGDYALQLKIQRTSNNLISSGFYEVNYSINFTIHVKDAFLKPELLTVLNGYFSKNITNEIVYTYNTTYEHGKPESVHISAKPKHGKITIDGLRIYYTPEKDFIGPESLSFYLSNKTGKSETRRVAFVVHDVVGIGLYADLPDTIVGEKYSGTLHVLNGVPPIRLTLLTMLAPGITFDFKTLKFSGIATDPGAYAAQFSVKDSVHHTYLESFSFNVFRKGLFLDIGDGDCVPIDSCSGIEVSNNTHAATYTVDQYGSGSIYVNFHGKLRCRSRDRSPVTIKFKIVDSSNWGAPLDMAPGRDNEFLRTFNNPNSEGFFNYTDFSVAGVFRKRKDQLFRVDVLFKVVSDDLSSACTLSQDKFNSVFVN